MTNTFIKYIYLIIQETDMLLWISLLLLFINVSVFYLQEQHGDKMDSVEQFVHLGLL